MRVAFVDQQGAEAGGAEESLALLLTNLPPSISPLAVFFEDGAFANRVRAAGIEVAVVRVPERFARVKRERPSLPAGAAALPAVFSLAKTLRDRRIAAVHTNTIKAHLVGAAAARLAGVACVSHLRDILDEPARTFVRSILRAGGRRRIAISRAVANAYALPATTVVPNPVDLGAYAGMPAQAAARAALGISWRGPYVGIVGRINRWKGHDRFLRIARRLRERHEVRFAIVGKAMFRDADFAHALHEDVTRLDLGGAVDFIGWQDDPRIAYAALDVICNCSTKEPFGRTTIEAAAAGRPTVAFDDGGSADAIDDGRTGRIVPAGDERAFAAAISAYLDNPNSLRAAGAAARFGARRFAADAHAGRIAAILEEAVA